MVRDAFHITNDTLKGCCSSMAMQGVLTLRELYFASYLDLSFCPFLLCKHEMSRILYRILHYSELVRPSSVYCILYIGIINVHYMIYSYNLILPN